MLRARLLVNPATAACGGGRSAAEVRGWLRRPTATAIGYSGDSRVPRCLAEYSVCRWRPRIPPDVLHGLPVWKPETLLAYMGARPGRFPWTDIAEWLPEACEAAAPDLVAAELDGRATGAWARTSYLSTAAANRAQPPSLRLWGRRWTAAAPTTSRPGRADAVAAGAVRKIQRHRLRAGAQLVTRLGPVNPTPEPQIGRGDISKACSPAASTRQALETAALDAALDVLLRETRTKVVFEAFGAGFKRAAALPKAHRAGANSSVCIVPRPILAFFSYELC